jgi:uncharacterized protein involved in exopolysaccharide biosynthesis
MDENRYFWLDALLTLLRWKKFLLVNVFVAAVAVALISLLLPNWYEGEATILPPESQQQVFSLGSLVPGVVGGMDLPLMASPSDILAAISESRIVAESVIVAHDLIVVYDSDGLESAVRAFHKNLRTAVLDNGIIRLRYEARDPELAAAVTNRLVGELDRVNRNVGVTRARASREFIAERLIGARLGLRAAEDSLVEFQSKNRAIALDEQTKAQIEILAQLYSEKSLAEIEVDLLKRSLDLSHPKVREQLNRVEEFTRQIHKLEVGGDVVDSGYLLARPLAELPDLAIELARLMRNVKIQETVFELLTSQFEQAKIEESKNTSTISVLDYASVPELKSRPKRSILVLLAVAISLALSLVWIGLIEFLAHIKRAQPERFGRWRALLRGLWLDRLSKQLKTLLDS